jgi:Asp-tRNA(Asn)/Glu-tRNA(Gln) amidotransferase B subunit
MLVTEMSQRLPGTLYDRTDRMSQLRAKEVALGLSDYADEEFRRSALRTLKNINSPDKVDVDIHFETRDAIEDIRVRGNHGTRTFKFDFNKAKKIAEKLPKGSDPFQVFNDTIDQILHAVIQLR